jgi:hypothetical protein
MCQRRSLLCVSVVRYDVSVSFVIMCQRRSLWCVSVVRYDVSASFVLTCQCSSLWCVSIVRYDVSASFVMMCQRRSLWCVSVVRYDVSVSFHRQRHIAINNHRRRFTYRHVSSRTFIGTKTYFITWTVCARCSDLAVISTNNLSSWHSSPFSGFWTFLLVEKTCNLHVPSCLFRY